ncbi:MAG TPA: HNH endonuclease signature motif containing protein [Vicinamibacteria bacterium]
MPVSAAAPSAGASTGESEPSILVAPEVFAGSVAPARPAVVRPLAPSRYEIRFTASEETRDRLRHAQDLLSHSIPSGDIAQVVDRALILLIKDLERRKFGVTDRSRDAHVEYEDSDYIPAAIKREVVARDGGRCRFVATDGHRCGATRLLQFHHVIPRAVGGPTTVANVELRCRAHNGYEVDRYFGPGVRRGKGAVRLDRKTFRPGAATRPGTSRPSPT